MLRFIFILFCCINHFNFVNGQWQNEIKSILKGDFLANSQVGIFVQDQDNRIIFNHNGHTGLIPASTLKLITALAIVDLKGVNYSYETVIGYSGEISNDKTLYGDLIIQGSGDPSLGAYRQKEAQDLTGLMNAIVQIITSKIACIDGNLIIDADIFDEVAVHPGWAWDDLSNYYATGIWGLNIHQNLYFLNFSRSNEINSLTAIQSIEPNVPGLKMDNQVRIGPIGSGDQAYIYGDPYALDKNVQGTIPAGITDFSIKGAIPDARKWFAQLLRAELEEEQIVFNKTVFDSDDEENRFVLSKIKSPPLSAMAKYALSVSDNMYCDAFFKTIGAHYYEKGTWQSAAEGMEQYLRNEGLSLNGYHQEDGSGLTLRNRISPSFLTSFLVHIQNKLGKDVLLNLLPHAGKDGSVKNFMNGLDAQAFTWAKSGSVNGVLAYAGVINISDQKALYFSINVSGHQHSYSQMRKQIEKIIQQIYLGATVN